MTRFRSATALRRSLGLSTALGVTLGVFAAPARAQETTTPTTPSVQSGTVTFADGALPLVPILPVAVDGTIGTLNVNVASAKAIVNWQTFDISSAGTTNFNNLTAGNAAILNRVSSADVSQIAGQMNAPSNLSVWLVNTNGILFGNGAAINVGGLVTSALDLTNDNDFLTSNSVRFQGPAAAAGQIGRLGTTPAIINTGSGVLALIAPQIDVNANINQAAGAGTGPTVFAIATDVSLTTSPGGPLSVTINAGTQVGTHNIDGAIVGDRVYALLKPQDAVNALLSITAPVTNATVSPTGVVVLAGGVGTATRGSDALDSGAASAAGTGAGLAITSIDLTVPRGTPAAAATAGNVSIASFGGGVQLGSAKAVDIVAIDATAGLLTVTGEVAATAGPLGLLGSGVTLSGPTSGGNVTIDGRAGTVTVNGALNVSGDYSVAGGDFAGASVFAPTFTGTGNDVTISDRVGGLTLAALTAPGTLTVNNTAGALVVGGTLASTDEGVVLNSAGGITLNAGLTATGGAGLLTLNGPTTLGADVTLATGGAATFQSTVDATTAGAQSLIVNAAGLTSFNGRVGSGAALNTLTTDAGGGTRINTDLIRTTGAQVYGDTLTLGANTQLIGASASFTGAIVGASGGVDHDLALDLSGPTTISGATFTGVRNLSTGGGGTTTLDGSQGIIATSGTQTYNDATSLSGAVDLSSTGAGAAGNIRFANTLDGAGSLATTTAGTARFDGVVGGTTAPSSIDTSGAAGTLINADITTSGAQTYSPATIGAGPITVASTGGGAIRFNGATGGTGGLVVNTGGLTRFGGAVTLTGLTTDVGGTTELNGDVTTTMPQTYNDAVVLATSVTLNAGANAVTFNGTLDSANEAQALTIAAPSSVAFNGDVGGSAAGGARLLALTANGDTTIGGTGLRSIRTVGAHAYAGNFTIATTPAPAAAASDPLGVRLTGTQASFGTIVGASGGLDHDLALDLSDPTTITGTTINGAAFSGIRNLSTGGGGTTILNGGNGQIATSGTQTYGDAVTLVGGGVTTVSTGTLAAGNIAFTNTLDGASNLIVTSQGTATFGGVVGGTTPLASLTVFADARIDTTAITTTGVQNYTRSVVLGATSVPATTVLTSTGAGAITFATTVDAATTEDQGLTVNTAGATTFGGAVGFTTRLASLTTDAGGTTAINGGVVTTEGDQSYGDPVTLGANTILTGRTLTYTGINAAGRDLTLRFDFPGAVSGITGVKNLSVGGRRAPTATAPGDAASGGGLCLAGDICGGGSGLGPSIGTIVLAGPITTTGGQSYNGNVRLDADTTVNAGGAVSFGGAVNALAAGAQGLRVNTASTTSFLGQVGGTNALSFLTTDAGGTTDLYGGLIRTTGVQTYGDQVRLFAATRLEGVRADFGPATQALLGQGNDLTLNMTGNQLVDGAQITGVRNFDTDRSPFAVAGTTRLQGTFVTTGTQTYRDAVELRAATSVRSTGVAAAGDISFANTVDGAYALDVQSGGTTTFGGIVGGTAALRSITTDAPGATVIAAPAVTTFETQTYNDAMTLGVAGTPLAVTLTSTGAGALGNVTFGSTLASADATQSLTVTAPNATRVAFNDDVGGAANGSTRLLSLTVNGATSIGGTGQRTIRTVNAQSYNGALSLDMPVAVVSGATFVGTQGTFTGAIQGNGNDLTLSFSGLTTISPGTFANVRNFRSDNGGVTRLSGTIGAGSQTYDDDVELTATTTLVGNRALPVTGDVVFNGTVNGPFDLTINTAGQTAFNNVVGGTAALASLATDAAGATAINTGAITTTGAQTFNDPVTLGVSPATATTTLTSTGAAAIRFAGTVDGARTLSVRAGTVAFGGLVGSTNALTGLAIRAGTATSVSGAGTAIANNRVGTLAASVTAPFSFDNNASLTIGTVDGLSGVTSAGAVAIRAGGLLTLAQGVSGAGVSLLGTGIVQATSANVAGGAGTILLDGNDGDITLGAALTTGNTGAQAVRLIDAGNVSLGDIATGAGGTLTLGLAGADNLSGNVTQRIGTTLTAGTLVGVIGQAAVLGAVGVPAASTNANAIGTLGSISAASLSYRSANALTIAGPVVTTGALSVQTNAGGMALTGNLTAGATMTLLSAGAITQGVGSVITAPTLTGSSVGGATLIGANRVGTLAGFVNAGAGGFAFNDTVALAITADVDAGTGDLAITAPGITFTGATLRGGGAKTLTSTGGIGGGVITGGGAVTLLAPATSPITVTSIGSVTAPAASLTINGGSVVTIGVDPTLTNLIVSGNTAIGQNVPPAAATGALVINGAVRSGGTFTSTTTGLTDLDSVDSVGALTVRTGTGALSFTDLTGAGAKTLTSGGALSGTTINGTGAVALTAPTTAPIAITGSIGGITPVSGLTIDGGSTVSIGTASSTTTAIASTGAVAIGLVTRPGALTVNGAITASSFTSRTTGTTDLDDVTSTGAIDIGATASGDVLFGTLSGVGAKTVTAAGGIAGGSILGSGAVRLTAGARPLTITGVIGTAAARAASLTVDGGAPVTLGSNAAGQTIATSGGVAIGQATPASALTINGGVDAGGSFAATATGLVDLDGVGAGTTLSATSTGGAVAFDRLVAPGQTTVSAATSITGNAIDGGGAVRLIAGTASPIGVGTIGAGTAAASLTVSGGDVVTFGAANAAGTTVNVAGATRIGQASDGAATGALRVNGNVVSGSFTSTTVRGSTFADVTSTGALSITTGTGDVAFANLLGAGTKTVRSGGAILGTSIQGAGSVLLAAATTSPIAIGSITTGGSLTVNGGNAVSLGSVSASGATRIGQAADGAATGALTVTGAITTGSLLSTSTGATALGAITSTGGDIGVTAGGSASIGGAVSSAGAYRVSGSTVALGGGVSQAARGLVDIVATGGAFTAGSGLTLQANSDGTGAEYLALQASGGIGFGGTTLLGGTAAQRSDIGIIAPVGPVTLGIVTGRALGGFDASRTTIGTLTTAGDITAGAIAVQRALALTSTGGLIGLTNAAVTDPDAGITLTTTAPAGGAITATTLTAPGAITVAARGAATVTTASGGSATFTGTTTTLTTGSFGAGALAITSTVGKLTLGTADAGATTLTAAGDVEVTTRLTAAGATNITATGAAALTRVSTTTGALTIDAGGNVGGLGTARADLAATGAGGNVSVRSRSGALLLGPVVAAAGGGNATLNAATSLDVSTLDAGGAATLTAGGGMTLGATTVGGALVATSGGALSLSGAQVGGDATFDVGTTATLGQVLAGNSSGISIKALDVAIGGTQRAARVTFTNRAPTARAVKLGNGLSGTGFALDQTEVNLVQAGQLTIDGGSGNVEIGALAFGNAAGSSRVDVLATGRVDVTGTLTGTGAARTFRFGGSAATGDRAGVIQVVSTPDAGGRLLFDTAAVELRGTRIGIGQSAGLLTALGLNAGASSSLSAQQVATDFVGNPNSALYNAANFGLAPAYTTTAPNLIVARSLTIRYGDYALVQNTGAPGLSTGVLLGSLAAPSTPALVLEAGNVPNALAVFGTINGLVSSTASVAGPTVIVVNGNADRANTRVNGCLVGSGANCLSSVVTQPALNVFDASRANVFRSADDLAVQFDPLVGTNNEALFLGLGLLDQGATATDCAADPDAPECKQPTKEQGK